MDKLVPAMPGKGAQVAYAAGSAAFTLLERLILLYVPFYYLPPGEYGLPGLVSDGVYVGLLTVIGAALFLGRVADAVADPVVAIYSDNLRLPLGRRKPFLLAGALPLALFTVLMFYPPVTGREDLFNGIWLALMMCFFYLAFTAYVNPYLSLLSELGHTNAARINISTLVALFGMAGMVAATVLFPEIIGRLQDSGLGMRASYRYAVTGVAVPSVLILYLSAFSFDEKRHCRPVETARQSIWPSLQAAVAVRPFRRFVIGEIFMQFSMNLVTLGMIYYTVVIFRQEERFMSILAALVFGSGLLFFPLINRVAKKWGKALILTISACVLVICSTVIFIFSFNMTGIYFYLGVGTFALAGIPTAAFSILVNPTVAEIARAEAVRTGIRREAMFFAARAVPLKITIALAGGVFGLLLSVFGRDVAEPLGVQLTLLLVSLAGFCAFFAFRGYPEKEVRSALEEEEREYR